jgi:hypothetical protein
MIDRNEAEEHLRIIRSLMEKATIYRAISAPGAAIGGVLSVIAAVAGQRLSQPGTDVPNDLFRFEVPWALVLGLTAIANLLLLRRDARRRNEAFVSQRMELAIRGMIPALLGGGFAVFVAGEGGWAATASLWVVFYGVSLLAAAHFAPKSICWLGRAFFIAGCVLLAGGHALFNDWLGLNQMKVGHIIMGSTFGLFHLIYAACTWPRKPAVVT